MDGGFLSGILTLLSFPCHTPAFLTVAPLLPLKASHLDPSHFSTLGPCAFAALPESLWEALSCPLPQLLGVPHGCGPFRRKGQDLFTGLFAGRGGGHRGLCREQRLLRTRQHQPADLGRGMGGIFRLADPCLARPARHGLLRELLLALPHLQMSKAGIQEGSCVLALLSVIWPCAGHRARREQQRRARIQSFFPLPEEL